MFKVGDVVKVTEKWERSIYEPEYLDDIYVIESINDTYNYNGLITTKITFVDGSLWAEPHEIRKLTKLERALK